MKSLRACNPKRKCLKLTLKASLSFLITHQRRKPKRKLKLKERQEKLKERLSHKKKRNRVKHQYRTNLNANKRSKAVSNNS
jgi:hypothetical protein